MRKISGLTLFLLLLISAKTFAQIPTQQDCLGALPICQNVYTWASGFSGSGNYPNEIAPGDCNFSEVNSLWMTFTVQQSGLLEFTITPNPITEDYDWALYNLTGHTCADILTNGGMLASCNSSQYGLTGINSTGTLNYNGPGPTMAFNAPLPVLAGETYVLDIMDWAGSGAGFTIDFGASTAVIFDNVPPVLQSVSTVGCNTSTLTFHFSENILCNTAQSTDFTLTGPGGPYTLSGLYGAACAAGGTAENTFTINVSPAITTPGTYNFNLVGASGYVTDLCGNVASATSIPFTINPLTGTLNIHNPACGSTNGSVIVTAGGGNSPYQFAINGGALQASDTFSNLAAGSYTITIQDASGCSTTVNATLSSGGTSVTTSISSSTPVTCFGACNGSATVTVNGGTAPFTYAWSAGGNTATNNTLCAGYDTVLVTDAAGCFDTSIVLITQPSAITGTISSTGTSCHGTGDGTATVNAVGGTGTLSYQWNPGGATSATATNLHAGSYTVTVTDQHNCTATFTVAVTEPALLTLAPNVSDSICIGQNAVLTANASGGTPPYIYNWNGGTFTGNPFTGTPGSLSTYTCVVTDAHGCVSPVQSFQIGVMPKPTVDLGPDLLLCEGETRELNATSLVASSYAWNDGQTTPIVTVEGAGYYIVAVSNTCGTAVDSVRAEYIDCHKCAYFPNAFSPNGDGVNDIFRGIYDCVINQMDMKIYSRWGELLYDSQNTNAGWDGTFKGQPCGVGVYIYVITLTGTGELNNVVTQDLKGNVTLIR